MDLVSYLDRVAGYVRDAGLPGVPGWSPAEPSRVAPLAQGEYNMNYLVEQGERRWVLRVNLGTQIGRADQIAYEYGALDLLRDSGVTPRPHLLDDSRAVLDHGVLVMDHLSGGPLDYRRDTLAAAGLFARLHSLDLPDAPGRLLAEERPLSATYAEASRLAGVYLDWEDADPTVRDYLREVLDWADGARAAEAYFLADPCPRVINTEVNSGNFIVDRAAGTLHLVDWEKPLWGDPSQDLSHFGVPTTTLWKTDQRLDAAARAAFLDRYRAEVTDAQLRDTIVERVRLRDPFNCLRGVAWSAMALVGYRTGSHALRNADTYRVIQAYLQPGFLRSLFDPHLNRARTA